MRNIRRGEPGHWNQQTRRDHDTILKQIIQCGSAFHVMHNTLRLYPKAALLGPLRYVCQQRNLPPVPRLCRRSKDALVCFFCLYCPDFPLGFPPLSPLHPRCRPPPQALRFFAPMAPPTHPFQVQPPQAGSVHRQPATNEMPTFEIDEPATPWDQNNDDFDLLDPRWL